MAHHRLTGLSVADTGSPVHTYDQLGGRGSVFNKALAIPMHLGYPWHSLEYVVISPVTDGQESSVGDHLQHTDEIYFIHRGKGVLTTNGASCDVALGFLAMAPRGTRHSIRNMCSSEELAFLVVELVPANDERIYQPSEILSLPALVEIPPGGRVHPYIEEAHDEDLFVLAGNAALTVAEERFYSWEQGLNVLIPRGLPHAIANRSSVEPLVILSILVYREGEEGDRP